MSLLTLLLPALVPVLTDSVRGIIGKFTGSAGANPQNVGEAIQLMEAQTKRVQALAELDKLPDGASTWVVNLRGAFRYVVCGALVGSAVVGTYAELNAAFLVLLYDMAGASMTFIIGERMYINLRGASK